MKRNSIEKRNQSQQTKPNQTIRKERTREKRRNKKDEELKESIFLIFTAAAARCPTKRTEGHYLV